MTPSARAEQLATPLPRDRQWTPREAAAFLGCDVKTLRRKGVPRCKDGRWVTYDPAEVIAWRDRRKTRTLLTEQGR